ncbi:MAG TPA: WYL domain-containing protein [Pyrinomonadaceae bacterium]|nr:WYL domain-containing protein [Pyrinomonadaceae bacterium]
MSHRGELTERMARLPLLIAERPHSQRELAEVFGVNTKTIRRDIETLSLYYPIVDIREGREVLYRFSGDYKYEPPPFSPGELATLLLAQESIAATGLTALGSPFARYGRSLLAKVRTSLPPSLRDKLDALAAVFGSASVAAKDFSPHAATIDRLTQAAVEGRRVRMRYYTLATDTVTERTVEPYSLYFDPDGATLKLIAYDFHRAKILPFAVDHIRSLRETDEKFSRPTDFDLHSYLSANCFNGIHGEPVTVVLRARGVTARVYSERRFHESQRTLARTPRTAREQETVTIELRVASGRGLSRFILSWGPDVEVLSPPALRQEIAQAHRDALTRYDGDAGN